jgi:hypothetical protein
MVRITRDGNHRFIWPVHLSGWQSLGWQLQPSADLPVPETRLPEKEVAPDLLTLEDPALEQDVQPEPEATNPEPQATGTDFQAMTKAQILEHCSSVYGVDLDGTQTKAELVEQATALELQAAPVDEALLVDGLLDPDDPLI